MIDTRTYGENYAGQQDIKTLPNGNAPKRKWKVERGIKKKHKTRQLCMLQYAQPVSFVLILQEITKY